jgi:hypothetical protein
LLGLAASLGEPASPRLLIRTLSSRSELVSGGDALVEVLAPPNTQLSWLRLTLNGRDVTKQLRAEPAPGRFRGLIDGFKLGENALKATLISRQGGADDATLIVTNHPITGPILSGPHLTPYECRTLESGLGEPLDANCSAATKVEYFYRSTDNKFAALADPAAVPADVVTTTTNEGKAVPYVVRVESGTINRSIYRIATLASGWNRKLVVSFGGGAGTQYNQGANQAVAALNHLFLSRGFAFMISTELVNQQHGNAILQGEALMMLKEHFIERYGVPKWTVGSGGSGGAIQQLVITQIYPGLLDGLQPSLAFPDSSLQTADSGLLRRFFKSADAAVWSDAKVAAVEGFTRNTTAMWERTFVPVYNATNARGCALKDASLVYDPVKNPKGARCTIQDMRANVYGRDPKTGFARKTGDNAGLQYGLQALQDGVIGVDEFLELNETIGGNDVDGNFVAERSVGDPIAIRAAYASGLVNSGGGGLANVPILHFRPYTDATGDIHDRGRDLAIRARLEKANGRSDNQVIWVGPLRGRGLQALAGAAEGGSAQSAGPDLAALAIDTMNEWLDGIASDPAPLTTDRVVRHKPAAAVDACWDGEGKRLVDKAACDALYPLHGEPRLVAGAPIANDVLKCQLAPVDYAKYRAPFSAEQRARMSRIFPDGVCDFGKPGVEQVPLAGTYQRYR